MLNKAMIIGRLGRDPELRYSQDGKPVCTMSAATDESYTDRNGQKVDRTEWHRIVVYGKTAETCAHYLGKGSLVFVEGSLQTRQWKDQQGQERFTTEIRAQRVQFLDRKKEGDGPSGGYGNGRQQGQRQGQPYPGEDLGPAFPSEASGVDDMPF